MESDYEVIIRVEQYQFIDNLAHIIPPEQVFDDAELPSLLAKVEEAFKSAGWEGDGDIGLIWLPPFANDSYEDTFGRYIWHVKQDNNGISFLGYMEYVFGGEAAALPARPPAAVSETITESHSNYLVEVTEELRGLLHEAERINTETDFSSLYLLTLNSIQNQAVSELNDYIDEVYLEFAEHVLGQNNPDQIRLTKAKINLPLDTISAGIEDGYFDSWLTLKSITSALWKDFKFWPFRNKLKEICSCVGFDCPEEIRSVLWKHIEIRNAIQHHNSEFTKDISRSLGQAYLCIAEDETAFRTINLWQTIELTPYEICLFLDAIKEFVTSYETHISSRMKTRYQRCSRA